MVGAPTPARSELQPTLSEKRGGLIKEAGILTDILENKLFHFEFDINPNIDSYDIHLHPLDSTEKLELPQHWRRHMNKNRENQYPFCKLTHVLLAAVILVAAAQALPAQSSIIAPGAKVELLASGFKFTEGPACDKAGNVYFTDQPNDRILIWSTAGKLSTFRQGSGRSNGLSFDRKGNLWACADEKNELWRISPSGKRVVVVKDYNGKVLNGPNDVWISPDGGVYFTDPFYMRDYWKHQKSEQDAQCVYYLEPKRNNLIRVVDDLRQPNGIIGTPDGKILYVADIGGQKTYRYNIQKDGALLDKKLFCEMGSDGMTIDSEGNVYLTGKGVTVFDSTGKKIEQIAIDGPWTGNVCFGGKDRHTLFITATQNLFGLRMRVKGVGSQ